eukprot:5041282-Pleurochrysis_carterae.AAC.2
MICEQNTSARLALNLRLFSARPRLPANHRPPRPSSALPFRSPASRLPSAQRPLLPFVLPPPAPSPRGRRGRAACSAARARATTGANGDPTRRQSTAPRRDASDKKQTRPNG